MNQSVKETVDYYLVFTRSDSKHWIFKLLHREIQHVYAVTKSPGEQFWMVIDPLFSHTKLSLVPINVDPLSLSDTPAAEVIPVTSTIDPLNCVHGFNVFSCVSVVKALLGMKKRFILTPYQLYKHIRRLSDGKKQKS